MVRILMNVRFGSIAAYHDLHLTVRFQYKADIQRNPSL